MDQVNRCKTLGVCQLLGCVDCPSSANIAPTGIVHQSLDAVDTTKSDKRAELGLALLRMFGGVKTGRNAKVSMLDKRECPHFCVPTRVIHRGSLVVFPIPHKFLKRFDVYDLLVTTSHTPDRCARGYAQGVRSTLRRGFLREDGFVVVALPINLLPSRSRMRVSSIRGMSYSCHWAISHPKKT